ARDGQRRVADQNRRRALPGTATTNDWPVSHKKAQKSQNQFLCFMCLFVAERKTMRVMIFIVAGVIAALVLLVGIVALIGSRLPKTHVASRSIHLRQSPQNVYAVVRDFGSAPSWRSDVKQMDVDAKQGGPVYFREVGKNGTINYELTEDVPGE